MVVDLRNKPYDQEFLEQVQNIYLMLPEPFTSESGVLYDSSEELLQLQLLESELLKAEVAEKLGGLFGGGLGSKARDIKAKATSMATDMKVAGSDLARGFKSGEAANKPPSSDLYDRSPADYWKERGKLATDKANADVAFNDAAKKYESGEMSQDDFRTATSDYAQAVANVDRGAQAIGSSFEAVTNHTEHLHNETKGVMPPTQEFPDEATKSGEEGSGRKLYANSSKNLSGSLWNAQVEKKGKAADQGKLDTQSSFLGPGAEGKEAQEAYEAAGGQAGEREALEGQLKNPEQAVQNLPKGSNIASGDREYLTKPGQKVPEGVTVHFGEPNAQGQRSRFYSKTEANLRRMARRQKEQGMADKFGPEGEKSEDAKARGDAAAGIKRDIEADPRPDIKALEPPDDDEIKSFLDELFPETKEKELEGPSEGDESSQPEDAAPSDGAEDSASEGEQESDASEGGQESDESPNEGDSQPSEEQSSDSEQPSEPEQPSESSPDTPSRPKGVSNIVKGFDAVQEREAKLNKNFNNLNKKLDSFSQGVENGDIKVSKRQAKKFATDVEAVSTAANGTRLANRNMRSSMTALTKTQNELDEAQKGIDTLTDSANQSPLDKEQKKELRDLKKQSSQLKKTRYLGDTAGPVIRNYGTCNHTLRFPVSESVWT